MTRASKGRAKGMCISMHHSEEKYIKVCCHKRREGGSPEVPPSREQVTAVFAQTFFVSRIADAREPVPLLGVMLTRGCGDRLG